MHTCIYVSVIIGLIKSVSAMHCCSYFSGCIKGFCLTSANKPLIHNVIILESVTGIKIPDTL